MADRPIIFSGPMVRALLEGRKTQTRRLATSPLRRCEIGDRLYVRETWATWMHMPGLAGVGGQLSREPDEWLYAADDPEWEAMQHDRRMLKAHNCGNARRVGNYVVRPSIHHPRWASRLTLTVTDVRRQPLNQIDDGDAFAEGVQPIVSSNGPNYFTIDFELGCAFSANAPTARQTYERLWDALHDKPGQRWADNPEIVALTFTVERRNIDADPTP